MLKFKEFLKNYKCAVAIFLAFAVTIAYFKIFRAQRPDWVEHPKVVETEIVKNPHSNIK